MSAWRPSEDHERLHIDSGPRINALHFISEALDIPRSERQNHPREVGPNISLEPAVTYSADIPQQQDDEDSSLAGSPPEGAAFPGRHLLNNHPHQNFSSETPYNTPASMVMGGSNVTTKTIVAADGDVSNGFVMSGRSLPYVFEASESGKNHSLILILWAHCFRQNFKTMNFVVLSIPLLFTLKLGKVTCFSKSNLCTLRFWKNSANIYLLLMKRKVLNISC